MTIEFAFADSKEVQEYNQAAAEIEDEVLDHIIQQTEIFLENMKVAGMFDADQTVAKMPDGRDVSINDIKDIFLGYAPDVLILLAQRIKYLQGKK